MDASKTFGTIEQHRLTITQNKPTGSTEHRHLLKHKNHVHQVAAADSILETKAQNLNLSIIRVIGDENCLQYEINAAHKEQTNHDDLRLLATALVGEHARKQTTPSTPQRCRIPMRNMNKV